MCHGLTLCLSSVTENAGTTEADAKDYASKIAGRTGLSDYTSKRLEELRLRRAESAADSYQEYRAKREAREKEKDVSTGNTTSSGTTGTDYLDLGRRGGDSAATTTASTNPASTITTSALTSAPFNIKTKVGKLWAL